jgi:hypothetical protein
MSRYLPMIIIVIAAMLAFVGGAVLARRRGYHKEGNIIARCGQGHLFTTVWVGPPSIRRVYLGWGRLQRCPVGDHWTLVRRVDESTLSAEEKKAAHKIKDGVRA